MHTYVIITTDRVLDNDVYSGGSVDIFQSESADYTNVLHEYVGRVTDMGPPWRVPTRVKIGRIRTDVGTEQLRWANLFGTYKIQRHNGYLIQPA